MDLPALLLWWNCLGATSVIVSLLIYLRIQLGNWHPTFWDSLRFLLAAMLIGNGVFILLARHGGILVAK